MYHTHLQISPTCPSLSQTNPIRSLSVIKPYYRHFISGKTARGGIDLHDQQLRAAEACWEPSDDVIVLWSHDYKIPVCTTINISGATWWHRQQASCTKRSMFFLPSPFSAKTHCVEKNNLYDNTVYTCLMCAIIV